VAPHIFLIINKKRDIKHAIYISI